MPRPSSRGFERNFVLGVANGVLVNGAEAFVHSGLVLAPFLAALGAPAWVIGLIPAVKVGGWFLPQLFVAGRLAHLPHKLPVYRRTSAVRVAAFIVLTVLVFLVDDRPVLLMVLTLALIAVHAVAGGIGGVPFADVTAKVVPHYRLGTFWALRNALGGLLALGAGVVIRRVLDADLPFPDDFGVIFACAVVLMIGSYGAFSFVREPAGEAGVREPVWSMLRRLPSVVRRDVAFSRYLQVRFLALAALMAEPFYAVYAITVLEAPVAAVGTFVIVATVASIAANFAFRLPANRAGNVTIMQASIACTVAAPVLALIAPSWELFAVVLALSAVAASGMGIAVWNLLYAIAPTHERPLYVGVANSILTLPSLAPVAVGGLVAAVSYEAAFAAAAAVAAVSLVLAFRLREVRELDRRKLETSSREPV